MRNGKQLCVEELEIRVAPAVLGVGAAQVDTSEVESTGVPEEWWNKTPDAADRAQEGRPDASQIAVTGVPDDWWERTPNAAHQTQTERVDTSKVESTGIPEDWWDKTPDTAERVQEGRADASEIGATGVPDDWWNAEAPAAPIAAGNGSPSHELLKGVCGLEDNPVGIRNPLPYENDSPIGIKDPLPVHKGNPVGSPGSDEANGSSRFGVASSPFRPTSLSGPSLVEGHRAPAGKLCRAVCGDITQVQGLRGR